MRREGFLCISVLGVALMMMGVDMVGVKVEAATGLLPPAKPPLIRQYYKKLNTCANVESFVQFQVKKYWDNNRALTPKLVKLLYTDCMVNGCDASILLDGPQSEKTAPQNSGVGPGVYLVIDVIKRVLEARCPGAVSCADIIHLATRDALKLSGAPSYPVLLGRRDGFESNAASVKLPSPSISWQSALAFFQSKGLDVQDMTTLLGGHTMGSTHCSYILDRLYNFNNTGKPDPTMNKSLLESLRQTCPLNNTKRPSQQLAFLNPDNGKDHNFTNSYYKRVLANKSVLGVDQQLLYGTDTKELTDEFATYFEEFRRSFALSMTRMGGIQVLTGKKGEIRRNCRVRNK
ncbi:hypothetical protein ACET3Z_028381 [Daucus carota]